MTRQMFVYESYASHSFCVQICQDNFAAALLLFFVLLLLLFLVFGGASNDCFDKTKLSH